MLKICLFFLTKTFPREKKASLKKISKGMCRPMAHIFPSNSLSLYSK